MKWSQNLIDVIRHFATINNGLLIRPGNVIRTISQNKAILARAVVEETFDQEIGIYDLTSLLALLDRSSQEVVIEDGALVLSVLGKIRYSLTDPKLILAPPIKDIRLEKFDVELTLTQNIVEWVLSVPSILKCPYVDITGIAGSKMILNVSDIRGEVNHRASITLDTVAASNFRAVFKSDHWKLVPGEYRVQLSRIGVGRFTHATRQLQYWIAIEESASKFG